MSSYDAPQWQHAPWQPPRSTGLPKWAIWLIVGLSVFALLVVLSLLVSNPERRKAHSLAIRATREMAVRGGRVVRSYQDGDDWIVIVRARFNDPVFNYWDYPIRVNVQQGTYKHDATIKPSGPIMVH